MSATGTIDGIQYKQSKAGKEYAKVSIDGGEYLAFGRTVDQVRRTREGSTVEYSAKPSDTGDGQIITFLKVVGGGSAPVASKPIVANRGNGGGRGNDQNIQLSIFYGYAKDLVAHGVLKPALGNPVATADLVSTAAKELMRRFMQDSTSDATVEAPQQEVVVESNPL